MRERLHELSEREKQYFKDSKVTGAIYIDSPDHWNSVGDSMGLFHSIDTGYELPTKTLDVTQIERDVISMAV